MPFPTPASGMVNIMIAITGISDRDRPEWMIAINGIRSVLAEAYDRSKAARRAVVRGELAIADIRAPAAPPAASDDDPDAQVVIPGDGVTSGVEFW